VQGSGKALQNPIGRGQPVTLEVEGDRRAVEDQLQVPAAEPTAGRDQPVAQLLRPVSSPVHQTVAGPIAVLLQDLGNGRTEHVNLR
jgi:hypothetical protein